MASFISVSLKKSKRDCQQINSILALSPLSVSSIRCLVRCLILIFTMGGFLMPVSIVYGMEDKYGHKAYSGFTFAAAAASVAPTDVETFGKAVELWSDAVLVHASAKETKDVSPVVAAGVTNIERKGVVIIKELDGGRRFNVTIPALKPATVDPNGTAKSALLEACETAILTAWANLTGLTGKVVASYSDGSQFQR